MRKAKILARKIPDISEQLENIMRKAVYATYTVDMPYPSGIPVADASTNTITLAGHGFANNDALEITTGTGALPGGLTAINASKFPQVHGKVYVYATNVTADTFQVYTTWGTVTSIDITSAGTAGWKVRKAGIGSIDFTGISLSTIGNIAKLIYRGIVITKTSTNDAIIMRINSNSNTIYSDTVDMIPVTYNTLNYRPTNNPSTKFGIVSASAVMDQISSNYLNVNIANSSQYTNDFATITNQTSLHPSLPAYVNTTGITDIISLNIIAGNLIFLNGTTFKIERYQ